jgi:hypothetical protein
MVAVHVAACHRANTETVGKHAQRSVPVPVAAREGPLQLHVEGSFEGPRKTCGRLRVDHPQAVACAAREADEPFGMSCKRLQRALCGTRLTLMPGDAGACVGVGEDPAEVAVAAAALAQQRHVGAALERDLRSGDRTQPDVVGGMRELQGAVHPVVVGQREGLVAESGGRYRELLGL